MQGKQKYNAISGVCYVLQQAVMFCFAVIESGLPDSSRSCFLIASSFVDGVIAQCIK